MIFRKTALPVTVGKHRLGNQVVAFGLLAPEPSGTEAPPWTTTTPAAPSTTVTADPSMPDKVLRFFVMH